MITRFVRDVSVFEQSGFSGKNIDTPIVMTSDWAVNVFLDGKLITEYKRVIKNRKLTLLFENFIDNKNLRIERAARPQGIGLNTIFSFKHVESWIDGITEAIQDIAIDRHDRLSVIYLFATNKRIIFLSRVREVFTNVLQTTTSFFRRFLFNRQTIGFISQCMSRPDKNDIDDLNAPQNLFIDVSVDGVYEINSNSVFGDQDKNSGVSRLGFDYSLVKEITARKIVLYRRYFEGIVPHVVLPTSGRYRVFIGQSEPLVRVVHKGDFVELTGIFEVSDQPMSISINDSFIPIRILNHKPQIVNVSECGISQTSEESTIQNWLNMI